MSTLATLILLPLLAAFLVAVLPSFRLRKIFARTISLTMGLGAIFLAIQHLDKGTQLYAIDTHLLEKLIFGLEVAASLFMLYCCRWITKKEIYIPVLILIQMSIMGYVEFSGKIPEVEHAVYVDNFSIIMALIIGIVGGFISVYAIAYMTEYHKAHPEFVNRRRYFFIVVFIFLSAMFGLVFSNHLGWMFFFWEITTLASFLLIGYSRSKQALRNAYRALGLNLLGGLGFALAILYLVQWSPEPTLELNKLLAMKSGIILIPVALISIAALAKAAQMPFSSWLLGAMVAPTPVSALLHSSTMVKAGVFVLIKFAPVLEGTVLGKLIALIGALTFLMTSINAVTQSNAKRVLAYSTIANLGLIVMCAGIGTPGAVWAAIFLVIFHAVAKGLLFLAMGPIEHRIGSRDIEDMGGLIVNRPNLAAVLLVGILGMFLAPFGMLISKYACIVAFVESEPLLAIILAFGSAPTLFFWTKWMGKICSVPHVPREVGGHIHADKWIALWSLAGTTLLACVLFPVIAHFAVDPYIVDLYGKTMDFGLTNTIIMVVLFAILFILPLLFAAFPIAGTKVNSYLSGLNVNDEGGFKGSLGQVHDVEMRNYYLSQFFSETQINRISIALSCILLVVLLAFVIL